VTGDCRFGSGAFETHLAGPWMAAVD